MSSFLTSLRICLVSLLVCSGGYTVLVLAVGQVVTPHTANGSIVRSSDGRVVGSERIAQAFTQPGYFWPRPSAVGFHGAGAGGSNKTPTSPDLTARAEKTVAEYGATTQRPLPPDLAAASGSGLDPHITERAARWQAERIATARGIPKARVDELIGAHAFAPGGFLCRDRIVNVLELNLALER